MEPPTQGNNELDFDPNHACEIQAFRNSLHSMNNEADKFQACIEMRDELLSRQTKLEWLCASVEEVMLAECAQYKKERSCWSTQSNNGDADTKRWERFVGAAKNGGELRKQCLAPLTKASGCWGIEKVQHYGWAYAGEKYCKVLGTAASRIPDWEEASVKLNRLILRRISAYWRSLILSVNPIDLIDLENLKKWPGKNEFEKKSTKGFRLQYQPVSHSDLPNGYSFDQYGLIVSVEVAGEPQLTLTAGAQYAMAQAESPNRPTSDHVAPVIVAPNSTLSPGAAVDSSTPSSSPASPDGGTPDSRIYSPPFSSLSATLPPVDDAVPSAASETGEPTRLTRFVSTMLDAISLLPSASTSNDTAPAIPEYNAGRDTPRKSDRLRSAPIPSYTGSTLSAVAKPIARKCLTRPTAASRGNHVCTCSHTVASELLSAIERSQQTCIAKDDTMAVKYGAQRNLLCMEHLKMYANWATISMLLHQHPKNTIIDPTLVPNPHPTSDSKDFTPIRKRRLSLPELGPDCKRAFGKVPRRDEPGTASIEVRPAEDCVDERPIHDAVGDALFRERVLAQLEQMIKQRSPKTWGELNNKVMYDLLSRSSQPVTAGSDDQMEAYYLTGEEAATRLACHTVLNGPIMTTNQQQFKWDQRKGRPIEQLFRRIGNLNRTVSVQKPSLDLKGPSYTEMRLIAIQDLFLKNTISDDPLNILDLRNPLPRSILPNFLIGEDCQLLSRVRDTVLGGATAERCIASVTEWNKWKDDEDWVLLAQGGAQTLTHQDSCGKDTWLTAQEGPLGFGWMSRPTEEERRTWSACPNGFTEGKLRYVILKPGQTIYFEAGTIHFVFRVVQHQTLFTGGHILRWSRVVSFMETVLNQLKFPDTTNEDILPWAPVYVETVAQLVLDQRSLGRAEELGGEEAIARFFNLKKEFEQELLHTR